jgi:hypothetical protein
MGDLSPTNTNSITSFTVTNSQASEVFTFQITDSANVLTSVKMIKSVLMDAFDQFVDADRADLITNGDQGIVDYRDARGTEHAKTNGNIVFDVAEKKLVVTFTAATNLSTADLTATAPFATLYS